MSNKQREPLKDKIWYAYEYGNEAFSKKKGYLTDEIFLKEDVTEAINWLKNNLYEALQGVDEVFSITEEIIDKAFFDCVNKKEEEIINGKLKESG